MQETAIRWALRVLRKGLTEGAIAWMVLPAIVVAIPATGVNAATQEEVADYVRDNILRGDLTETALWMTEESLDTTYFARDLDPLNENTPFPFSRTWLVVIDDAVGQNRIHAIHWLFVNDNLSEHTMPVPTIQRPTVHSTLESRPPVGVSCVDLTGKGAGRCPDETLIAPAGPIGARAAAVVDKSCLNAVLISGGWSNGINYAYYADNLGRMYRILRACGYPAANISVYYAVRTCDGGADHGKACRKDTDCAGVGSCKLTNTLNLDGDVAGTNEVTDGVDEPLIRAKISTLCTTLDPDRDVLFIYTSNHGSDDEGLALWNWDGSVAGPSAGDEIYSPTELGADTADCRVCRLFMVMDQCYSGEFLGIATDGAHANTSIYVAATGTKCSWGSEYLDAWDDNDASTTTMNDMHQHVVDSGTVTSTPGSAEGTAKNGDTSLCVCWEHDPHATAEETQGTSSFDFGAGGTAPAIPADFFGPGSDPFTGHIALQGDSIDPGAYGNASTDICRGGAPVLLEDVVGSSGTVTIEIVGLNLVATQPITVTFNGGQNPEEWTIRVGLSQVTAPLGTLTATKTHHNGGTFSTVLHVQPKFTFTKSGNPGEERVLDTGLEGLSTIDFSSAGNPFVHVVDPSLNILSPSDGTFVPGVEETIPGLPSSQEIVPTIKEAPGTPAQHVVVPASTFCSNNVREVGEQCDGTDDAKCPGSCLPDCTCAPGTKIPAVSEWGLGVLLLLVLTAGTVVLGRRRYTAA